MAPLTENRAKLAAYFLFCLISHLCQKGRCCLLDLLKARSRRNSDTGMLPLLLSHFSRVRLCATPQMAARQAPLSLGFSRQEHWSRLPFPSPTHESEEWKWSHSVVSDTQWPHGLQPTRLLRPWDFPGKSTGVGCHCLLQNTKADPANFFDPAKFLCPLCNSLSQKRIPFFKLFILCWSIVD